MGQKPRGFFHSYGGGGGSRALPCPPQELRSQGTAGTRCSGRCLVLCVAGMLQRQESQPDGTSGTSKIAHGEAPGNCDDRGPDPALLTPAHVWGNADLGGVARGWQ